MLLKVRILARPDIASLAAQPCVGGQPKREGLTVNIKQAGLLPDRSRLVAQCFDRSVRHHCMRKFERRAGGICEEIPGGAKAPRWADQFESSQDALTGLTAEARALSSRHTGDYGLMPAGLAAQVLDGHQRT
jgi:hypothetical protein